VEESGRQGPGQPRRLPDHRRSVYAWAETGIARADHLQDHHPQDREGHRRRRGGAGLLLPPGVLPGAGHGPARGPADPGLSKIQKLKTMAFLGVSGIVAFMSSFVVFFLVASLDQDPANNPAGGMQMFPQKWFGAAATVPNVLLSVSYQLNFFPIFKGMKNVTDAKMGKASGLAIAFCTISYLLVGILGYQYVGNGVTANFLNSLSYEKISPAFFFIINISFLLSIFFAFPIMFFSCRNNFIAIVKLFVAPKEQDKSRSWRAGD
jgi:hypothetical protein